MKKLMTYTSVRLILGFWFIVSLFVFGNTLAVKAEDTSTVEGEWEIQSSYDGKGIGSRHTIVRKDGGYEVFWTSSDTTAPYSKSIGLFYGSPTQIMATTTPSYDELLFTFSGQIAKNPGSADAARSALGQLAGKATRRDRITVSSDGLSAEFAEDKILISFDDTGRLLSSEIEPFANVTILVRVAPPAGKVESRGEHAYPANCGPTVPNRTAPITTDLCPGNLVAMTYFCGGDTGCPYVCCPKGLPYLNHCDCKCYATADFECHSYSKAQEQPRQ